jgi:hypothetical protein
LFPRSQVKLLGFENLAFDAEVIFHPPSSGSSQPLAQLRLSQQAANGTSQELSISGWNCQSGLLVDNHFGRAVD